VKRADTTSKWDVLTFFAVTFPISRASDTDIGRQDGALHWRRGGGGGGGSVLILVRGDVHNFTFEAYRGYVILMKTLRSTIARYVYGVAYEPKSIRPQPRLPRLRSVAAFFSPSTLPGKLMGCSCNRQDGLTRRAQCLKGRASDSRIREPGFESWLRC